MPRECSTLTRAAFLSFVTALASTCTRPAAGIDGGRSARGGPSVRRQARPGRPKYRKTSRLSGCVSGPATGRDDDHRHFGLG